MPHSPLITFLIALTGLCLGSMVTLVSYRLPLGMPVTVARSQCMACKTPLGFKDLFPLLSWLTAKGKCRYCGAKVSARYPLIELATMTLTLAVYFQYGLTAQGIFLVILSVCLMILIVTDFEHYIIPDAIQIVMAMTAVAYHLVTEQQPMANVLAGGLAGLLTGVALSSGYRWLRKKEGLGMGDVKLLAVAGLWLGPLTLVPLFFFAGALGVVIALPWRVAGRGAVFPFGPAIAAALWALLVYSETGNVFWNLFAGGLHF